MKLVVVDNIKMGILKLIEGFFSFVKSKLLPKLCMYVYNHLQKSKVLASRCHEIHNGWARKIKNSRPKKS